jgi:predicted phage terminase large subunit-like protein
MISEAQKERWGLQVVAHKCRADFFYFVRLFWDVIIAEEAVFNWHIEYLCRELEIIARSIVKRERKPYDLIINIPPGTTKTTIITIMFPAWIWTLDGTIRIISNSYAEELSLEHATKSRDIITSDKYKRLFPEIELRRDKSAKSAYENTATGARYTTSTGSKITGRHSHLILSDDPLNPSQAASEAGRKGAIEHTKTLATRKVNKANTPTVTIMQRLHEEDVTGYLLSKDIKKIKHICLPAELTDDVKPAELRERYVDGLLDPVRLSREVLDEQKSDLGSIQYSCQYDQNPTAEGGNIIKKDWFRYIHPDDFERLHRNEPMVFFVDTAFTEKTENDPSGAIAVCKIGNDLYVTDAKKWRLKFPDLIKALPAYVKDKGYSNVSTIRIEPKANGLSVIHQLQRTTGLNVVPIQIPLNENGRQQDKIQRANAASPTVECGRIFLVSGAWNEDFVDEICGFPNKAHDEYMDALGYAIQYLHSVVRNGFDLEAIHRLMQGCIRPVKEEDGLSYYKDFEAYEEFKESQFVVSVVADRIGGSVIKVFDRIEMMKPNGTPEVVAMMHTNVDKDKAVWKAVEIAKMYDDALLVVANVPESGFDFLMDEIVAKYKNIYYKRKPDEIRQNLPVRFGFPVDKHSKVGLYDFMNKVVRDEMYVERDYKTCSDMELVELKSDGTVGVIEGGDETGIICTAMGLSVCYDFDFLRTPCDKQGRRGYGGEVVCSEACF